MTPEQIQAMWDRWKTAPEDAVIGCFKKGSHTKWLDRGNGSMWKARGYTIEPRPPAAIGVLLEANKKLRSAASVARDAIASTPEDTFGHVPDTPDQQGWWIRDELVHNLTAVIAGEQE